MKRKQIVDAEVRVEACEVLQKLFEECAFLHANYRETGVYVQAVHNDGVKEFAYFPYETISRSYAGQHEWAMKNQGLIDVYNQLI